MPNNIYLFETGLKRLSIPLPAEFEQLQEILEANNLIVYILLLLVSKKLTSISTFLTKILKLVNILFCIKRLP